MSSTPNLNASNTATRTGFIQAATKLPMGLHRYRSTLAPRTRNIIHRKQQSCRTFNAVLTGTIRVSVALIKSSERKSHIITISFDYV